MIIAKYKVMGSCNKTHIGSPVVQAEVGPVVAMPNTSPQSGDCSLGRRRSDWDPLLSLLSTRHPRYGCYTSTVVNCEVKLLQLQCPSGKSTIVVHVADFKKVSVWWSVSTTKHRPNKYTEKWRMADTIAKPSSSVAAYLVSATLSFREKNATGVST